MKSRTLDVSPPVETDLAFCPQCGTTFQEEDIIVLNGTKEDVQLLKKRMEERRLRAKLEKVMRGLHFCSRVHCKLFCCLTRCWGWGGGI